MLRATRHHAPGPLTTIMVLLAGLVAPQLARLGSCTRVLDIDVRSLADGTTATTVVVDGTVETVRHFALSGPSPRLVVTLAGIDAAFRPYEIPVGDANVVSLRIGHHPELDPPQEHLVFDLTEASVELIVVHEEADRIVIVLGSPSPGTAPPATSASATVTPRPTLSPPPPSATLPSPTPPPPPPTRSPAEPTPARARRLTTAPASNLTQLVVSHRPDLTTLVRVTADRSYAADVVDFFAVRTLPPRYVLRLHGARTTRRSAILEVFDANLCEIQVIHEADTTPPRTDIVLFLASTGVTARAVAVRGSHAVVELTRSDLGPAQRQCETRTPTGTSSWQLTDTGNGEQ